MKKKLLLLLMFVSLMLPIKTLASTYYEGYKTMNLVEALAEEKIELVNKDYKETDDQAIIYLFRGNGCGFCRKLLTYLSSITKDYGKYFKVVSFEVWYDSANSALMNKMPAVTGVAAGGVPYYIIGDETFDGYNESYNDRIIAAIKKQYENKDADVFEKLEEYENGSKTTGGADTFAIIFWNFVIIAVATGLIIYFSNKKQREILRVIEETKKSDNKKNKTKENEKD